MPRLHWEDFVPGHVAEWGPRVVIREEMTEFAREFDPQPAYLGEDGAAAGGLLASDWFSCATLMRIIADGFLLDTAGMGSPGIEETKWLAPLRAGDRCTVRGTVKDARPSNSRPDRGFVRFLFELRDASGTCLTALTCTIIVGRRTPAAEASTAPAPASA